jgi:PBP1b-binding outer membrane lipoprotein LpoB
MIEFGNGMGRKIIGAASAVALAVVFSGCAKQESVVTAQADTHAEAIAQADLPEVIVTASRDSATSDAKVRHE